MNKSTKIVREIIVKEIVFIKNHHSNCGAIMGDYKIAKCLYQKEVLTSFSFSNAQKILNKSSDLP